MKLDGAIFTIEQRSVGGCLDLAVVFFREHFLKVMQLLMCFMIPSLALTWWLSASQEWTLYGLLLLFFVETPFFGAALVAASGRRVFGEKFSVTTGLKLLGKRLLFLGSLFLLLRGLMFLAAFLMVFPAYLIGVRFGFLAEVALLEGAPASRCDARMSDLLSGVFLDALGRVLALSTFQALMTIILFFTIDLGSSTLLNMPVLWGRVSAESAFFLEDVWTLIFLDPRVATVLIGCAWVVFAVARLAWMFCYLDIRIRKEGWDVELDFRVEAQRLEAAA